MENLQTADREVERIRQKIAELEREDPSCFHTKEVMAIDHQLDKLLAKVFHSSRH